MQTNTALSEKQIDYALAEHAEVIRTAGRAMIENVLEIGRHLTEAKRLCEPGQWLAWLEREFKWTRQTADNLMNVYAMAECKRVYTFPDLPLRSLYLLARPSTPEAVRQEVLERAASGERIPHERVKQEIAEAKQAYRPQAPNPATSPRFV